MIVCTPSFSTVTDEGEDSDYGDPRGQELVVVNVSLHILSDTFSCGWGLITLDQIT